MKKGLFYQFGKLIYKTRWIIVLVFVVAFISCIPFLPQVMSKFTNTGLIDPHSQSALADKYLDEHLNYRHNRFIIMYQSQLAFSKNDEFNKEIKHSLSNLKNLSYPYELLYPNDNKKQVSEDKHSAYAVIMLKSNENLTSDELAKFKSTLIQPPHLRMLIGGEPIFQSDLQAQTQKDLIKAEYIASPIAVITLLIVFGSFAAALVPMILDGMCAILILTTLFFLGHYFSLSIFTINIALLLGLCLSLDYALFIISRFREELVEGYSIEEALAMTQATAGKAVFFSGLAVLISLSALFMFPIDILFSVGMGGVIAVSVAVLVSIVLLPALLAILKSGINFLPIRILNRENNKYRGYWMWLVTKVIRYPWTFFIVSLVILFILSFPIFNMKIGLSDYRILPKTLESRQVFDILKSEFKDNELSPVTILIKSPQDHFLTKKNIGYLYSFTRKFKNDKEVADISSIVDTDPALSKTQYQQLYTGPKQRQNDAIKKLLLLTTFDGFTVVTINSHYSSAASQTKQIVKKTRQTAVGDGLKAETTGITANTMDVIHRIAKTFPYALLWVIALTYLILLVLLRSLFLPVKAIITNILSLAASYGVLVFIIQDGYFASWLNFDPQRMIDISLLVIIFCALFGFSMDYEVFLLTRIKEFYEQTDSANRSVCYGIVHSSKIITSAAVVVILICFAFLSADILIVKAFGLGIAVAIFVDAFLIRTILVPATMTLLQRWCWYLPKWLDRILPDLSFNPEEKRF